MRIFGLTMFLASTTAAAHCPNFTGLWQGICREGGNRTITISQETCAKLVFQGIPFKLGGTIRTDEPVHRGPTRTLIRTSVWEGPTLVLTNAHYSESDLRMEETWTLSLVAIDRLALTRNHRTGEGGEAEQTCDLSL